MDKRGLELAWNTIVVMIIAFIILIVLILVFTGVAGDFTGNIKSYIGYSNVDNVIKGCNVLADTSADYSFCCEKKKVKYYLDGEKAEGDFSCEELINKSFIENKIKLIDCGSVSCGE